MPSHLRILDYLLVVGLKEQFFKMSEDVFEMHLFEDEACLN